MNALRLLLLSIVVGACHRGAGDQISGTGTLEMTETDVGPMQAARVVRVLAREGVRVHAGDTLALLTTSTLRSDIAARQARVASATAQLRELENGARPAEIQKQRDEVRAAESEADRTTKDLARLEPLFQHGDISAQQLDAARAAASQSTARRDAARSTLRLLTEGTRPERIAAARAEVANARAAESAALATASDLVLLAPVDGLVLGRWVEPGEVIPAGTPAVTLGDATRPYVRVYVDEFALPGIHIGDAVTGVLDASARREFHGRVIAVNTKAEFTPRIALTEDERADLLFGVKVEFPDSAGTLKAGLPITVRFAASPSAPRTPATDSAAGVPIGKSP